MTITDLLNSPEVNSLVNVFGLAWGLVLVAQAIRFVWAWLSNNRAEARRIALNTFLIAAALILPAVLSGVGLFYIDNFIACSTSLYEEGSCPDEYTVRYVASIVFYFAVISFIPAILTLAAYYPVYRWLTGIDRPIIAPSVLAQAREIEGYTNFIERLEEVFAYYSLRLLVSALLIGFLASIFMAIESYAFIKVNPSGAIPLEYTTGNFAIDLAAFTGGCLASPLALSILIISPLSYRLIRAARESWVAA